MMDGKNLYSSFPNHVCNKYGYHLKKPLNYTYETRFYFDKGFMIVCYNIEFTKIDSLQKLV